jgi:AraC-like DNA-binding protein
MRRRVRTVSRRIEIRQRPPGRGRRGHASSPSVRPDNQPTASSHARPASLNLPAANDDLGPLLSALEQLLTTENADALLRQAVELARDTIGLVRVSIYVLDQCRHLMLGTWGSDSRGALIDEHHVMYAMRSKDQEAFQSGEEGEGVPYRVFEDCLIVEHRPRGTKVVGRGWVTCTPLLCNQDVIGMMFNDAGPSDAAFDEGKQAQAAILCSLLGTALGSLPGAREVETGGTDRLPVHRLVMASVAMLAQDPGVRADQIARQLAVNPLILKRLFEATLGVSLAEYRNRLRLDRFAFLMAKGRRSLSDAAVAAGFASFAQFQQVALRFRWMAFLKRLSP